LQAELKKKGDDADRASIELGKRREELEKTLKNTKLKAADSEKAIEELKTMGFEIESKVPDAFKKSLVNATEHASKI
jgi:hypothetical protein